MPESECAVGITELRVQTLASHGNFRVDTKDSGRHVWLILELGTVSPRTDGTGQHLSEWMSEMLDPDSQWDSVKP